MIEIEIWMNGRLVYRMTISGSFNIANATSLAWWWLVVTWSYRHIKSLLLLFFLIKCYLMALDVDNRWSSLLTVFVVSSTAEAIDRINNMTVVPSPASPP